MNASIAGNAAGSKEVSRTPVTNKVEQKVAYFELVDGVVLVAGAYKK